MGFVLTVIYVALALLSPADLIPSLAGCRVELVLAIFALLFSAQELLTDRFLRSSQVYILAGLVPAVFASQAIGNSWVGGGVLAVDHFLPAVLAFYLILLNCKTLGKLKVIASVLVVIAAGLELEGGCAYLAKDLASPFLLLVGNGAGEEVIRMRGLGFLHDPNDLAQLFVLVIPLCWLLWQNGRTVRNICLVIVPTIFFNAGIYMTHSRGGMLALLVIFILGMKNRVGLVVSTLAGSLACVTFLLLDFTGGREVSMAAGSGRMAFWGTGLEMFKASPLFGIGMGNFTNQNGGHTAHNSFVLCLAELGIVGYMLWMGLLVSTFSRLNSSVSAITPIESSEENSEYLGRQTEISRWARMLRISLAGFLTAAWFLSRTYAFMLYLGLAMAVALCWVKSGEAESLPEQSLPRLASLTAMFGFGAIAFLYAILRARVLFLGPQ